MELFVKHLWWHRVAASAPNGDAITECGMTLTPSTLTASPELVEQGSGCVDCIPDKAHPTEIARKAAEAAEAAEPSAEVSLDGLTKAELVALAAERGVEVDPKWANGLLRDALKAHAGAVALVAAEAAKAEPEASA